MRIRKANVKRFVGPLQEEYNALAEPIISNILQTENEAPISYINARLVKGPPRGYSTGAATRKIVYKELPVTQEEAAEYPLAKSFGNYERVVFWSLVKGDYSAIALVGDRGAGKTAVAKYIKQCLEQRTNLICGSCQKCKGPQIVHINFNLGYRKTDVEQLKTLLYRNLYNILVPSLYSILSSASIVDSLPGHLIEHSSDQHYSAFYKWATSSNLPADPRQMVGSLIGYVETNSSDISQRVELLMTLVRFYRETVSPNPACFVMIFDNLDSVVPEAQRELFDIILSVRAIGQVRALVPLRWATFEQNKGQKAFSFDLVTHRGPAIKRVLETRLRFYLDSWEDHEFEQQIGSEYAARLKRRIKFVLDSEVAGKAKDLLSWIAGDSVKCGLLAAKRFFINTTVAFDAREVKADSLVRCLLVGNDRQQIMDTRDDHVCNIFADRLTGNFTLLNLRILQLTLVFEDFPERRRISTMAELLQNIELWELKLIRHSFEQLLNLDRPLIWADSRSRFGKDEDILSDNSIIYLTSAGEQYYLRCLLDLAYMQESLISVSWPPNDVRAIEKSVGLPEEINYTEFSDRFNLLRAFLAAFLNQDAFEMLAFREWLNAQTHPPAVSLEFISNRSIYALSRSLFYILRDSPPVYREQNKEILRDWLNLTTTAFNEQYSVLDKSNGNLASLMGRYRDELGSYGNNSQEVEER